MQKKIVYFQPCMLRGITKLCGDYFPPKKNSDDPKSRKSNGQAGQLEDTGNNNNNVVLYK